MTCQKVLKWKIIGKKKEKMKRKKLHKMLQRVVHKICLIYAAAQKKKNKDYSNNYINIKNKNQWLC